MAQKSDRKRTPLKGEKAKSTVAFDSPLIPIDRADTHSGAEVQKYSLVARNPIVKSALDLVQAGVFWASGGVKASADNNYEEHPEFEELDIEITQTINNQLNTIGQDKNTPPNVKKVPSFLEFLKSSFRSGRIYGYSVSELVWDKDEGINRLWKLKTKPSWNFDFIVNDFDEMVGITHDDSSVRGLEVERFIVGTWPILEFGNYYGVSDLQSIEEDVLAMELLQRALAKGGSFSAFKPLIAHFASAMGKKERDTSKLVVESLSGAIIARLPMSMGQDGQNIKSHEFEVLEDRTSDKALENVWAIINELIKRINRSIGVPDDLGEVTVAGGSFARARVQFDVFISRAEQGRQWVQELANRVTQTICYYNYQNLPEDYNVPEWTFDTIEEEADSERAKYYEILLANGVIKADEPFIREDLGVPPAPVEDMIDETDNETGAIGMEENEIETEIPEIPEGIGQSEEQDTEEFSNIRKLINMIKRS